MTNDKEHELKWLRYEEVNSKSVSKDASRFLGSREAEREVKAQAKEDRKRGR